MTTRCCFVNEMLRDKNLTTTKRGVRERENCEEGFVSQSVDITVFFREAFKTLENHINSEWRITISRPTQFFTTMKCIHSPPSSHPLASQRQNSSIALYDTAGRQENNLTYSSIYDKSYVRASMRNLFNLVSVLLSNARFLERALVLGPLWAKCSLW